MDLKLLGDKIRRIREQIGYSHEEVEAATGISNASLHAFESGSKEPTGDEILVISDFFRQDYKFFVSNDRHSAYEQTETLFRMHGDKLSKGDRVQVFEFIYLCECEDYLWKVLDKRSFVDFNFQKRGEKYQVEATRAARELRQSLGFSSDTVPRDVFAEFRRLGIHVFRRALENSQISGLFLRHPTAGRCILVNYNEDPFRQRFTAAHEAGHAIMDNGQDGVLSGEWSRKEDCERRANRFASCFLVPRDFLGAIPIQGEWNDSDILKWGVDLRTNPQVLTYALDDIRAISREQKARFEKLKIDKSNKTDPELPQSLSDAGRKRRLSLLKRGLSAAYVRDCFDARRRSLLSEGRLAEMLLTAPSNVHNVAALYGEQLQNGN